MKYIYIDCTSIFPEDFVSIKYWVFICLMISWVVIYLILCKGIASSGKVTKIN